MHLEIVDSEFFNESDSDYDTAVDISHYYFERQSFLLRTPAGALLQLDREITNRSSSYLEPDWDLVERTGQVQYEHHQDPESKSSNTVYRCQGFYVEMPVAALSVEDFMVYKKDFAKDPWASHLDDKYPEGLVSRLRDHAIDLAGVLRPTKVFDGCDPDGLSYTLMPCGLSEEEIESLYEQVCNTTGKSVDVSGHKSLMQALLQAEAVQSDVVVKNRQVERVNAAHEVNANLRLMIDEMAHSLSQEVKRSFAVARP